MKASLIPLLLLFFVQCKQPQPKSQQEQNPFGRFERWLNAPISKDFPNKTDLDSIWGISLPEQNWLIEAKARLACVREKATVSPFGIQSSRDVGMVTSYIGDLALRHGCDHITIDSFIMKIKQLQNPATGGTYSPAKK
jgi:hypothetical protein